MAKREFVCLKCWTDFVVNQRLSEPSGFPSCPKCGSHDTQREIKTNVPITYKGSGWTR